MFDRRVVRGSTYAQQPLPVSAHNITHTSALPNKDIAKTSLHLRASIGSGIAVQVLLQGPRRVRGVSGNQEIPGLHATGHFKSSSLVPVLIHENPFHIHPIDLLNCLYLMPLMPNAGLENREYGGGKLSR
jgi:hypothetical protein